MDDRSVAAPEPNAALHALQARLAATEERLAAEQARRAYVEQILANVNDAVIIINMASHILEWNAAAERTYGWAAQEVIGRNLGEVIPTRYLDGSTSAEAFTALEQHGVWTGLVAHPYRDGHEVMIESAVRHLRDTAGQVIGLVGINRDVTARIAAEEALRRSEANLRAFFDSAPQSHYLLDRDYRILAFNHVTATQVRAIWQRDIVEGESILPHVNPENRDAFIAHYQRCLRGEASRYERKVVYASGRTVWYELTYTPISHGSDGTITGVAFSGLDISERKQTELALAHREAQLAGIIDSAMDAIITVDADQQIVLFNRAAEHVFGCAASVVLGQPIDRFIPPDVRVAHHGHIPAFGQTGVTRRSMYSPGVLEAVRTDGSHFPIEASISQITIDNQPFYTVILRDISQRKELEAQLLQSQKMESIGRLAGGIAHDFNNLLTVIGGVTDLVREALPPEHHAQSDLAEVSGAAERAAALTRQLLAFARQQVLDPRTIDINALIQETAPLLHRLIGEDITVILDLMPGPASIKADANQLQQLLMNLAVNARDAMPEGGFLRISTRRAVMTRAEPGAVAAQLSSVIRIIVQDTGGGMTPAVQARIFEPFFTTKAPGHGTGLGLATCYGIVAQHGGQISVSSQLREGSAFTIDLPGVSEPAERMPQRPAIANLPHGGETILVVEDEVSVRAFVERVLGALGYTVLTAQNGFDALRLVRGGARFDLLLTDVVMPELRGPALVARLATSMPRLRVIYMSGYTAKITIADEPRGQAVMLQKPFTQHELAQLVRAILDQA